jgi:20S proteasome subunit beta 2
MTDFRRTQNTFGDAFPTDDALHGGFNFDNCRRNELLLGQPGQGGQKIKAMKTGTTIVGVVYKDGVVLGADTRSTGGSTVMDKNCEKIHYIAPNIYCCGAGTAADTENTTALISSQLELHRLNTDTQSRVVTAMTLLKRMLFQYQGHVSAALVLGGVDVTGPHLYTVYPHGSTDKLPFVTMGSGSLAAMSVFEHGYKDNMTEDEAKRLVQDAILAGIFNDLGSGSNVDITIIKKVNGRVEVVKDINSIKPNEVSDLRNQIMRDIVTHIPRGATHVLSSKFEPFPIVVEDATPMDLL